MLRIINQIKSPIQYVRLKYVNIKSIIHSFAADVTITQIFRNDKYTSIKVVYYFPIEEQTTIYNFTARIDNREIIAQLKEREDRQFEQDNFIINIGILPPLKECLITISYITKLDFIQESIIRFVIPKTILPQNLISLSNKNSKYLQLTPYKIQFRSHIEKLIGSNQQQYISQIKSPSHHINIDRAIQDFYIVTFTQNNTYLDHDIILDIKLSNKRANTFVVPESNASMAVITPFKDDCEFIFIIDCSKSMKNENKIGLVREAMIEFLKNLPNDCYFNIIKFGTKYTCLFNQSAVFYNHINVQIAEKFISQIRADLGGTEIFGPLHWLERHPPQTDRARQVFLLTDGQISNVSEVLELCRSISSSTRIVTFCFGESPRRSFVKALVRQKNNRFIFIPPNTNINVYVKEQLQKSIRHCIKRNLRINVENIPNKLPIQTSVDRSIDSRIKKTTNSVNLYPSTLFTNQYLVSNPIHVEKPLLKKCALTNDNNACYYRKQDSLKHIQSHYDTFSPMRSSTPMPTRSSILLNQHKFRKYHVPEKEVDAYQKDDKDIIRYLINQQTLDGLWNFDSNRITIKKLTGKSLSVFQSSETPDNLPILITAIIIVLLEVKFMTLQSLWIHAAEKARQCLIQLLNNDWKKLVCLFRDIRKILNG